MPPSKNFPAIQRAANDRAFTFLLIEVLQNYPLLKQNIWPALGDKVQGSKKSQTYQSLAERVLEAQDEYKEAVRTPERTKSLWDFCQEPDSSDGKKIGEKQGGF